MSKALTSSFTIHHSPFNILREHGLVVLGHLALTLLFTWPLVANFATATPGFMLEDRDQNLWNLWWVSHAITNLQNPYHTNLIYYPAGVSLYFHTLAPFNGLLAVPLIPLFGLIVTYNLIVVISFVLTGFGSYLLVKHILSGAHPLPASPGGGGDGAHPLPASPGGGGDGAHPLPASPGGGGVTTLSTQNSTLAFVASVAFTYSAFHLSQLRGIMQLISLEWLPFYLYFLMRLLPPLPAIPVPRGFAAWRDGTLAALCLLLLALVDWYYTMYALLFTALYLVYLLLAGWRGWLPLGVREVVVRTGATLLLGVALMLPILVPMLGELRSAPYVNPSAAEVENYSADLAAFVLPMRDHPIFGSFSRSVRDSWPAAAAANQYEVYLGFSVLMLAAIGLFAHRNRSFSIFLTAVALLFFSLALGPVLHIGGVAYPGVPMPYRLFDKLPFASISRSPDRFTVLVTLCLSILLAFGLQRLGYASRFARRPSPQPSPTRGEGEQSQPFLTRAEVANSPNSKLKTQNSKLLAAFALILLLAEFLPIPYRMSAAPVPAFATTLAQEMGDFSILELPRQDGYWGGGQRMRFQTVHGKSIFGGYISREYNHPFVFTTPGFAQLELAGADIVDASRDQQLAALDYYHVGYVVLYQPADPSEPKQQRGYDPAPYLAAISSVLGTAAPAYSDTWLTAWRVPVVSPQPFLAVGDGWYNAEDDRGEAHRWMSDTATLRVINPFTISIGAALTFSITTQDTPRSLTLAYPGGTLRRDIPPALTAISLPMLLPPGESIVRLTSPSGASPPRAGGDPRRLSFAVLHLRITAFSPSPPK